MAALEFGRQADVNATELLGEDVTDQITLVAALHDDNEHAGLGIVQSRREHFVPHPKRGFPDNIGFDLLDIMGIIDHDDVGAKAGNRGKRHGPAIATGKIVELRDLGVVEPNAIFPALLVPVRLNQPTAGETVLIREPLNIGEVGKLHPRAQQRAGPYHEAVAFAVGVGILRPCPGWEEYIGPARFHVPRRQSEDERAWALDLATRDCHQMIGHTINVPVRLEVLRLSGVMPRRPDKIAQRILITNHFNALACRKRR